MKTQRFLLLDILDELWIFYFILVLLTYNWEPNKSFYIQKCVVE